MKWESFRGKLGNKVKELTTALEPLRSFKRIKKSPFVIDATRTSFGGKLREKIGENEGIGGVTLGSKSALDGLGDGRGVRGYGRS